MGQYQQLPTHRPLRRWWGLLVAGLVLPVVGVVGGCALLSWVYATGSVPQPYPGVPLTVERGVPQGRCCDADIIEYRVPLPLETVRQHYDQQLSRYCVGSWRWEPTQWAGYSTAERMMCEIERRVGFQYFTVILYSNDSSETFVLQEVEYGEDWP